MNSGLSEAELGVLGAKPLTPDDPDRVGRFRLLGVLGSGGMGRVYLGWADSRLAAVKVIRPELADSPQFRRRFAHELEAVSRLDADFTAPLVDAEADATRPWMATAYVPGLSLEDAVLGPGSLPAAAVWRLAAGAASALAAIHRTGIIHRDLKPSNVILALDGPKVIDFGVAHAADLSQLTVTGQHVGTPAYMAPEQAKAGVVGPASDVFALGGLLMFAATGRPPFGEGSPTEVLFRVVHEPPDLTGLQVYDAELYDLVSRCLDKDLEQRPDAAAVAAAVADKHAVTGWPEPLRNRIEPRAALAARASLGEPGSPGGLETAVGGDPGGLPRRAPAPTPVRRRRGLFVLAAVLTVAIVALGAVTVSVLARHPASAKYAAAGNRSSASVPASHAPGKASATSGTGEQQGGGAATGGGGNNAGPGNPRSGPGPANAGGNSGSGGTAGSGGGASPVGPGAPGGGTGGTGGGGKPGGAGGAGSIAGSSGSTPAPKPWSSCNYYSGDALTQRGDSGPQVREVQCILQARGYDIGPSGVDGQFGDDTQAAVERFQRRHNLQVDGQVGEHTWAALRG